jgi:hypothetical protein
MNSSKVPWQFWDTLTDRVTIFLFPMRIDLKYILFPTLGMNSNFILVLADKF